jgi:hypothetical protein
MSTQKYEVNNQRIEALLAWVKSGEIAIPEIQRPFVWPPAKVRNLMDSLYQGFPVGYIITWLNPHVRLKDGTLSRGKKILIDGQQRVTALRAALVGEPVLDDEYRERRIVIAFHPVEERFEVLDAAIKRDKAWIHDISVTLQQEVSLIEQFGDYLSLNPDADRKAVERGLTRLSQLAQRQIGVIELTADLDIETATEIFVRINDAGVPLSQADFAMSKIAADSDHDGQHLRKTIDYFCHAAVAPHFISLIAKNDPTFAATDEFRMMQWLQYEKEDLYDPSYVDMLRVVFGLEFKRAKLSDLVALVSGRNFETRTYEKAIVEESFALLRTGMHAFMRETSFKRFLMIIRSAGFRKPEMIRSSNAINFAYLLYLWLVKQNRAPEDIERLVKRWFVMSILTSRATGSFESQFDRDIKQLDQRGADALLAEIEEGLLGEGFWRVILPQNLDRANASSPFLHVFFAAQANLGYRGFLSKDITVTDLLDQRGDIHHVFPKVFMRNHGHSWGDYNQVANLVLIQQEINIRIGAKAPAHYMAAVLEGVEDGTFRYGAITDRADLELNLAENAIPLSILHAGIDDFPAFLAERRSLMSATIERYYKRL